ncbi:MAG: hypothetical protein ABJO01_10025 [Parasphingorhabdus sp.]|uniref:hypothetical protein n=1 Tax=Parasphingorhabdus sp. TaxID=2709688 RepID=UPI0032985269
MTMGASVEFLDFEILDDSGLLGLVDVFAYSTFVSQDWEYEQLLDHFADQMSKRSILVWECSDGGNNYRLRITKQFSQTSGWREVTGSIAVTNNKLNIASYTALTMAAQFDDQILPGMGEQDFKFPIKNGTYKVRIIQNYNPETVDYDNFQEPHFILEIEEGQTEIWPEVAWENAR